MIKNAFDDQKKENGELKDEVIGEIRVFSFYKIDCLMASDFYAFSIFFISFQVLLWKERAKKEEALKEAGRKEKDLIHQLVQAKREVGFPQYLFIIGI